MPKEKIKETLTSQKISPKISYSTNTKDYPEMDNTDTPTSNETDGWTFDQDEDQDVLDGDEDLHNHELKHRHGIMHTSQQETFEPDEMPILEEWETRKRAEKFRERLRQKSRSEKDRSELNPDNTKGKIQIASNLLNNSNLAFEDKSHQGPSNLARHGHDKTLATAGKGKMKLKGNMSVVDPDAPSSHKTAHKLKTLNLISADLKSQKSENACDKKEMFEIIHRKNYEKKYNVSAGYWGFC